jgi:hypothetical protein
VMAEPGVGKSRLFFEFKATSRSGWMMLETFSISHGKASASDGNRSAAQLFRDLLSVSACPLVLLVLLHLVIRFTLENRENI